MNAGTDKSTPATPGAGQIQQRGNFMKTTWLILGVFGLAISSPAQTNSSRVATATNDKIIIVTNWIQPSDRYCYIGKQLFDKYHTPQFVTVDIPAGANIGFAYNGPVDFTVHPTTLTAFWQNGKTACSVVIKNYPFVRGQWNYNARNGSYFQPGGLGANALAALISDTPIYNGFGAIIRDSKIYDCGTPMTEPIKIVRSYTPEELAALQAREKLEAQKAKDRGNQSQVNAVKWLQPQATNGSPSAQCSLGLHYLNGQGCETNREAAIYWLRIAADQGNLEASNKLATLKP